MKKIGRKTHQNNNGCKRLVEIWMPSFQSSRFSILSCYFYFKNTQWGTVVHAYNSSDSEG